MAGRNVRLTPKGFLVMVRHRRISARRASGVGCVRAVRMPSAPAFDTADAISAVPTCCIPPYSPSKLIYQGNGVSQLTLDDRVLDANKLCQLCLDDHSGNESERVIELKKRWPARYRITKAAGSIWKCQIRWLRSSQGIGSLVTTPHFFIHCVQRLYDTNFANTVPTCEQSP